MENFTYNNKTTDRIINNVFRYLLSFLILSFLLIFFLSINDTVKIKDGEIQSTNPQVKINAPFNLEITSVLIKEGQRVNKGDTLFIFNNSKIVMDSKTADQDIIALEKKLNVTINLLTNAKKKKIFF